ncbi:MAG: hypothetical protein IJR71_04155 [Prevotella sp.]|nr:hypothetical protein [Prevotella sp.]
MKKYLYIFLLTLVAFSAQAQNDGQRRHKTFDPVKFEAEMEQFITTNAGLTQQESTKFFPLYREMRKKMMENFDREKRARKMDWNDEKTCEEAIRRHDQNDIRMKELQKVYHEKFLEVLPATKVLRVIRAEDKFHRQTMKRMADHHQERR